MTHYQAMGAQEIRSFLCGRHPGDKGLYVSTGGFSKDAHYEAAASLDNPSERLIVRRVDAGRGAW